MREGLLTLVLAGVLAMTPAAQAQDEFEADPCEGQLRDNEAGVVYAGHCIAVDKDGDQIQAVLISRTESLDGITGYAIYVVETDPGVWTVGDAPFLIADASELEVGQ